jgi:hypothetical protein
MIEISAITGLLETYGVGGLAILVVAWLVLDRFLISRRISTLRTNDIAHLEGESGDIKDSLNRLEILLTNELDSISQRLEDIWGKVNK